MWVRASHNFAVGHSPWLFCYGRGGSPDVWQSSYMCPGAWGCSKFCKGAVWSWSTFQWLGGQRGTTALCFGQVQGQPQKSSKVFAYHAGQTYGHPVCVALSLRCKHAASTRPGKTALLRPLGNPLTRGYKLSWALLGLQAYRRLCSLVQPYGCSVMLNFNSNLTLVICLAKFTVL